MENGGWKRLFPIRFRRLDGEKAFTRWDIVDFEYSMPRDDKRRESCRVHEESIRISGRVKSANEKSALINRALVRSEKEAISRGDSLALIRPQNVGLRWRRLSNQELLDAKAAFSAQASQLSLLEEEIAAYEPCPFQFTMTYDDLDGPHSKSCADWETSAAFFNLRRQMDEAAVLRHLEKTYCDDYVRKGLVLALGNMKSRPQTWQLLGIFPVEDSRQGELF